MDPRPPLRLLRHPVHFVSLGFGSGLSPVAPGTFGTLAAWALYPLLRMPFSEASDAIFLSLLLFFFLMGCLATHYTGKTLGVPDHGAIVWDEIVAMWLVLFFTPATFIWQAIAVALFRLFDILKPPPIRQADRHFKNGFGVMVDDLLAAAYALLALAVLLRIYEYIV